MWNRRAGPKRHFYEHFSCLQQPFYTQQLRSALSHAVRGEEVTTPALCPLFFTQARLKESSALERGGRPHTLWVPACPPAPRLPPAHRSSGQQLGLTRHRGERPATLIGTGGTFFRVAQSVNETSAPRGCRVCKRSRGPRCKGQGRKISSRGCSFTA